jgi:predicted HTH transcriptional regulator
LLILCYSVLLREYLNDAKPFDKEINCEATIYDIDLQYFRDQIADMGRFSPDRSLDDYLSDTEQIAEFIPPLMGKLPLDDLPRPRNFSLLMFGKRKSISRYFTNAYTILSVYPGSDRSESFAERLELTGPIILQALRAIDLLNLQCVTIYDKNSDKPNQKKYSERAIREAVVNAIVHRDYEIDRPNRITVFSDRLEIESVGSLHWAVDKDMFVQGKSGPKWRNQAFAYLFNKLHLSQSEGQGIPTIFRTMRDEGCPPPRFEMGAESVTCILPAHERSRMTGHVNHSGSESQ